MKSTCFYCASRICLLLSFLIPFSTFVPNAFHIPFHIFSLIYLFHPHFSFQNETDTIHRPTLGTSADVSDVPCSTPLISKQLIGRCVEQMPSSAALDHNAPVVSAENGQLMFFYQSHFSSGTNPCWPAPGLLLTRRRKCHLHSLVLYML